mmetsp:Transcript_10359/g.31668  ORF Transcript_10359/g.31668 Transcript_10359/m.31668 type:complete len:219 (-) Transcript_10359:100-756(-)
MRTAFPPQPLLAAPGPASQAPAACRGTQPSAWDFGLRPAPAPGRAPQPSPPPWLAWPAAFRPPGPHTRPGPGPGRGEPVRRQGPLPGPERTAGTARARAAGRARPQASCPRELFAGSPEFAARCSSARPCARGPRLGPRHSTLSPSLSLPRSEVTLPCTTGTPRSLAPTPPLLPNTAAPPPLCSSRPRPNYASAWTQNFWYSSLSFKRRFRGRSVPPL